MNDQMRKTISGTFSNGESRVEYKYDKFVTNQSETINKLLEKINNMEKGYEEKISSMEKSQSDMREKCTSMMAAEVVVAAVAMTIAAGVYTNEEISA